jgi:hypothetical protein
MQHQQGSCTSAASPVLQQQKLTWVMTFETKISYTR